MYPKREFRFPTLIGLLLVGVLIAGLTVVRPSELAQYVSRARTPAENLPQDIRISNITNDTAVVSWTTSIALQGEVKYNTGDREAIAYDIRDSDGIPKAYYVHYVQLTDLSPKTSVEFEIINSGSSVFSSTFTTGAVIDSTIQELPIHGQFYAEADTPTKGTIVMTVVGDSALWSTFIQGSVNWIIPVARMRTQSYDLLYCARTVCNDQTLVSLEFYGEEGKTSYSTPLENARPVPIILSFKPLLKELNEQEIVMPTIQINETSSENKQTITNAPLPTATKAPVKGISTRKWEITILNPKKDAKLSFPKPLIRGQGVPDEEILITIDSKVTQIGKVIVGENGTWRFTPAYPLESGEHTVTITTKGATGIKVTKRQTFYILKSGQQVLSDSTPSASLTPTATPTPPISPSITTSPTTTPKPKTTPTRIPTSSISATPTPSPTLYVAGGFVPSMMVIVGGMSLLVLAFALL